MRRFFPAAACIGMTAIASSYILFATPSQAAADSLLTIGDFAARNSWPEDFWFRLGITYITVLAIYYTVLWSLIGRPYKEKVIIENFTPPEKLSPAISSYVYNKGLDMPVCKATAFSAALASLGVKGYIEIHEKKRGNFELKALRKASGKLSVGEKYLMTHFFADGRKTFAVDTQNKSDLKKVFDNFVQILENEHEGVYFKDNLAFTLPPVFLSVLLALTYLVIVADDHLTNLQCFTVLTALAVLHTIQIRALTPQGREKIRYLEGFRYFLKGEKPAAEEESSRTGENALKSPKITPALFEQYLPYAIALGVIKEWEQKFKQVTAAKTYDKFKLKWYTGARENMKAGDYCSGFYTAMRRRLSSSGISGERLDST